MAFEDYTRGIGQDTVNISSDPWGASHQKYTADLAAAAKAKIDEENRARELAAYQQQSAQLAADNASKLAAVSQPVAAQVAPAAAVDPFAQFRGLNARQQQKISSRPGLAQRRGIAVPTDFLDNQYAKSPVLSLEEWNRANNFDPKQSFYINQQWGPDQQNSYTTVKSPTIMNKSYSPYQMYLNEYNAAKIAGAGPVKATIDNPNKAENYYYYTLGKGANTAAKKGFTVPTW